MRLACNQKDLSTALSVTNKAVDLNNTLPVLNNVLLKAEGKKLYFTATNLEVAMTYFIEADVKNEGQITIPSKLFTNYVNYIKDEKINLSIEDGETIYVETTDSKTKIKGISAAEFPSIPTVEKAAEFTLSVSDLKEAINQVVFAASLNTTRPVLAGVYFILKGKELKMVSTDSYRLSEKTLAVQKSSGDTTCIIPARTMMELGSILDNFKKEDINVIISNNQVLFSVGPVQFVSRLIEGQFPNYEQIIPKETGTIVDFSVEDLSLVLKRINLFAKENNNKVILKAQKNEVFITTDVTQYGAGEIVIKTPVKGEGEIALNSQYILDALTSIGEREVTFKIGEKIKPVIITPKKEGYLHIIMPLKI